MVSGYRNQRYSAIEILRYYYNNDMYINAAGIKSSILMYIL